MKRYFGAVLVLAGAVLGNAAGSRPELQVADVFVSDGETAFLNLILSSPSAEAVTVSLSTQGGPAKSGLDYGDTQVVLVFNPGETVKQFAVQTLEDDLHEGSESFNVHLHSKEASIRGPAKITITDDDSF